MNKYSFDIKHTNIAKGFFILAMIFHHVFASEMNGHINPLGGGEVSYLLTQIAFYGKICVGGFAFLSAYGITKKLTEQEPSSKNDVSVIITRLVKFYFSYWPIFIIGIVGSFFFSETSLTKLYINPYTNTFSWILPIVDALGLSTLLGTPTINMSWWYISVALFIILATPLYNHLYSRFKGVFALVICILPYALGTQGNNIFFTIPMLGVVFAREDLLSKIMTVTKSKWWKRLLALVLSFGMIGLTFELSNCLLALSILPLGTFACLYFCINVLSDIPVLKNILEFLGKHSANIFFIHTFLYYYWFTYSVYNLGNKFLIYGSVLGGALLISILLEIFKKIVRYNKLQQFVISHLTKLICK